MILYSLESLWNYLQEYPGVHLIWSSFEASEYPKTVGSSGHTQKSASSCFDHNFLLWTPILMILDSIESLWKCLQEYPKVHIIRSSFEHQNNWWPSDHPITSQKSASSCFDHNFLLRTPILMIFDTMESLWKCLQEYPEVHIISWSFGHWFNASV